MQTNKFKLKTYGMQATFRVPRVSFLPDEKSKLFYPKEAFISRPFSSREPVWHLVRNLNLLITSIIPFFFFCSLFFYLNPPYLDDFHDTTKTFWSPPHAKNAILVLL